MSSRTTELASSAAWGIVRDHDDGLPHLTIQRLEQRQHAGRGLPVEVSGRLVAHQQRPVGDDRASNRAPLLQAAREARRLVRGPIVDPDDPKRGIRMLAPPASADRCQEQRQHDVGDRRQARQQVVELKDEPVTWARPPLGQPRRAQRAERHPVDSNLPRRRSVQAGDRVQQRPLPGAGRPHQRREIALPNREIEMIQHDERLATPGSTPGPLVDRIGHVPPAVRAAYDQPSLAFRCLTTTILRT